MEKRKKNIVELTRVTMDDYRKERKLPLKIVVDSVRSMNNIGSIFRTSDAFLIDEIILCGISSTPPTPKSIRQPSEPKTPSHGATPSRQSK